MSTRVLLLLKRFTSKRAAGKETILMEKGEEGPEDYDRQIGSSISEQREKEKRFWSFSSVTFWFLKV